ncbi:HIT family protein [Weissella sagaensis]|uniref:HIT family protein n=1 Tax=Weissella sagaensis TaxID=2559928 RepID=A0ABW1RTJ1_9LACO|nr:HIT family protein [Weissella sagaensis]MBU7567934.1 HIT family protein [Weissella hellenica]QDJ58827.1 HIT family protein [Weissella hellenica]QEA57786.1 HIT family protein [Weissella hellenica]UEG66920.1 HIT family protein [Weissella hellenica]
MSDIFDKIIDGSIPSYKVYEDDNVLAFLDLTQATPGHTLVVPKKHVADIFEYDDELAAQVLGVLPKIAQAIKASDERIVGLNIINNNGEYAGQSVFHSHFHLLPRYEDDGFDIPVLDHTDDMTEQIYQARAQKIADQFKKD